ncbi:Amino acid permease 1 [Linum grandiflorum]
MSNNSNTKNTLYVEQHHHNNDPEVYHHSDHQSDLDDDGRPKRTGTWVTASAHIITAVIGSGVLSLAWAIAQLGWVAGPVVLLAFSFITLFTSTLLADAYRSPDPVSGKRNYTYMDAAIFGCIQLVLSQIPNFHKLSWLSILAAVMSFAYSIIGLGLSIAKVAGGDTVRVGVDVSAAQKVWRTFQAIGDIAFAYAFSTDTLKSSPPENKSMKRGSLAGIMTTTLFYVLCGCVGYAAFGNDAPGNFLTGFGFYEPFWLIDLANICIAIHLVGAYQVFCQPIYSFVESSCQRKWPENKFITKEHPVTIPFCGGAYYNVNLFRLVWRSVYVVVTVVLAMIFPFFNDFLGLIGAASFWPLTVYFPIEMYIARAKIPKYSFTWTWLQILTWTCLAVSLLAAAGSVEGLIQSVKTYQPFQSGE